MRNRIYLVHVETLQNALKRMTAELGDALGEEGFEIRLLDPAQLGVSRGFIEDFSTGRLAGVVSINFHVNITGQTAEAFNAAGVKLFYYGTDHPYFGYDEYFQHVRHIKNLAISLTSDRWVEQAGRLFGRPEVFRWLPQGASTNEMVPLRGRDIGHLVVANNILTSVEGWPTDPAVFRASWPLMFGLDVARKLNAMVEVYQARPMTDLSDMVGEVLSADLRHYDFADHRHFAELLELYLRTLVRAEAIQALIPFDAVICGKGWEYLAQTPGRAVFRGSVESGEVWDLIRRARAVYNVTPSYYECSERVLEAVSFGTPVVTSHSRFFHDQFGDTLRYFRTSVDLAEILATPEPEDVLEDRVARARALFVGRHDWRARAREIATFMREPPIR